MPPSEEEIKAQLMTEAEAAIDKLLSERKKREEPNLTDIEDMALAFRQELGEKATQVLADSAKGERVPGPKCPTCGQEMRNKGRKRRRVVTRSGEIELERTYYYCEHCKQGFFPSG